MLEQPEGLRLAIDQMVDRYRGSAIEFVAGVEARGFIFGPAVAHGLGAGFIPLRKPGKLPGEVVGVDYELEYGADRLEMHVGAIRPGAEVLVIDDLIATGGTAAAAIELVRMGGGRVHECCFVIDLPDLGGSRRLREDGIATYSLCSFEGA